MDVRANARKAVITLVSTSLYIVMVSYVADDALWNNNGSCYRLTKNVKANRLIDLC